MKLKIISCRVFKPELDFLLNNLPAGENRPEIEFLDLKAHNQPDNLREKIQNKINESVNYDAVVLIYGLCGNATAGIKASDIPLYIPKAHDCSQILLGSSKEHKKFFGETPSRAWTSRGYMAEEGDPFRTADSSVEWTLEELIREYGKENAEYVYDVLHASDSESDPVLYFLNVPETEDSEVLEEAHSLALERGKTLKIIPATVSLIARLISGRGGNEILYVPPGAEIQPSWDSSVLKVINSKGVEE
jgi:hypothetical protein